MNVAIEQEKIKAALKHVMRGQKYTYADLAKIWGCSLPTVKRQLGAEELPLTRLLEALDWLNLSLSELQQLAQSKTIEEPRYTLRQNEFLAKNPREFAFLMKLYEEKTAEQIAREYRLEKQEVERLQIRLERHDLIRVGRTGQIKPVYFPQPNLEGELARAHTGRILEVMAQFVRGRLGQMVSKKAAGIKVPDGGLSWGIDDVSEKTYLEFLGRFRKLMEELGATAKIESKALPKAQLKKAFFNYSAFLCEADDRDVQQLADIFGESLRRKPQET